MFSLKKWIHRVLAAATCLWAASAHSAINPEPIPVVQIDQVGQGSLLIKTDQPSKFVLAPTVATDVKIVVTGIVARAEVAQRFHNPSQEWVEAVYAFPLPEKAAVDHLRMTIGHRIIEGQIQEKEAAKKTYEQAKLDGKKAALVEQERPNVFTTWAANIGPGEDIEVTIVYQETIHYDQGVFSLRFPMVVGPRYTPGMAGDPAVPQIHTTQAVLHPSAGPINPVRLRIDIDPGFATGVLRSPSHEIKIVRGRASTHVVSLKPGAVPADRDFVLEWAPQPGRLPQAAVFSEETEGMKYFLLLLIPPRPDTAGLVRLSRETIFVIDTSGSMANTSIDQARQALTLALGNLQPEDSFNVIQFNSYMSRLFPASVPALPETVAKAKEYVAHLNADGGTEMLPALQAALRDTGEQRDVRQVIFITDGCVSNEDELFRAITGGLGASRLFTVGIGSAPNSYFMRKAAEFGRGTFTYVGDLSEVSAKMGALFAKLESPVLSDVRIAWSGAAVEAWPDKVPDLYLGEPVVVAAATTSVDGVEVFGRIGGEPWQQSLRFDSEARGSGIGALWARHKIEALMDTLSEGAEEEKVRPEVVAVALQHHLVSKYTSLVAVDVTPTAPQGADTQTHKIPANLPSGWKYDKVFGTLPQTATPGPLYLLLGLALITSSVACWWILGLAHRRACAHARERKGDSPCAAG
ncbi:MAG: marine proteobacterial sortase target protein [Acidobacteria bacterium]|nr:marine proteobacterial sortase target protein [Acidobacteriota bacterium]